LLLAAVFLAGCSKTKETNAAEEEAAVPVTVETAVAGAIDRMVLADAVLYPIDQSNPTPKISAPVKRMLVNRGDHVRAGQLLAELESADLAAAVQDSQYQLDQAQAAYQMLTGATVLDEKNKAQSDVQAAQSALDTAKKVYDSRVALQKEGALAQRQVDETQLQMTQAQIQLEAAQRHLQTLDQGQREAIRAAEAQVNSAKARLDSAQVQLSYARIVSPIAGVVADRPVYPGEMANAGSPIASIINISQLRAVANVPAREAATIKVGRPARITTPEGDLAGSVTVVSPAVDPTTTTVEVWIQAPNPGEKLKPGGTVRAAIIAETIQNALIVPAAALLNAEGGGQRVMVVDKNMVVHERMVAAGVRQGERVQIASGVQEGDQVVTSGGLGLDDGAKVTIQAPASEDDDDEDAGEEAAPAAGKK
jgi:HlyD family secretion protein